MSIYGPEVFQGVRPWEGYRSYRGSIRLTGVRPSIALPTVASHWFFLRRHISKVELHPADCSKAWLPAPS